MPHTCCERPREARWLAMQETAKTVSTRSSRRARSFLVFLGVFPEASLRAPRFGKENRNAEMEDARGARVVVRRRGSRLGFCSAAHRDRVLRATHLHRSTGKEGRARGSLGKPHGGNSREEWNH